MTTTHTLFTDFLEQLGVPHTKKWSSMRFEAYPPKMALEGTSDLLFEYHVRNEITHVTPDVETLLGLKPPFIARTKKDGLVIVTAVSAERTDYIAKYHRPHSEPTAAFADRLTGECLTATPRPDASEPDFADHRYKAVAETVMTWSLVALASAMAVYFFVTNGLWRQWWTVVQTIFYASGLYISYLLVLKDSHVESAAADSVCSVIQATGCSTVLGDKASRLFGLIGWCEIGFTYFSVSLLALLLFPAATLPYLPWIAVCCLPYTIWSVCYQKFRIHAWCTLCLCIQTLLWLSAMTYLGGRAFVDPFPLRAPLWILAGCYGLMLLAVHKAVPVVFRYQRHPSSDAGGATGVTPLS